MGVETIGRSAAIYSSVLVGEMNRVAAVAHSYLRPPLEVFLERPTNIRDRGPLVAAIRCVLDGERDADALCEALDQEDALIVQVILRCLENPETLRNVLGGEAEDDAPPEPLMSR
jgi:hypothetical protein